MGSVGIWAALAMSAGVGLVLGLVGGGGSILVIPILVYVAAFSPSVAVALSLPIVGVTAAVGGIARVRAGDADLRAAGLFASTGIAGAMAGAPLTRMVPGPVLLLLFAALMIAVGLRMVRESASGDEAPTGKCLPMRCALAGLGVGVLTGFLGVGGGFLIVPALLRFASLSIRKAAGTSLLIIAVNSAAGFLAHLKQAQGSSLVAAGFTLAALLGLGLGMGLERRVPPTGLKRTFGALAVGVALFLIVMNFEPVIAWFRNAF